MSTQIQVSPKSASGIFGISDSAGVYTYYATLTLAMAAAVSGQTIEMFADVTETGAVTITLKNGVNINGNGHTYTLDSATTTNAFIDGGVSVVMNMSNITLVRKGAGAGTIIGLSAAANRIVGLSTFLKVESPNSFGFNNYGGATLSGYINGFTISATGSSCAGINLYNVNVNNCNVVATGNGIRVILGIITNSYGESTGSGNGIDHIGNGYTSNSNGKSNTGVGISLTVPCNNSTGFSSANFGISSSGGLNNCVGISAATYGIYGSTEKINNCTAISTGGLALFWQNGTINNTTAISTVNSAVNIFNATIVNNSTLITLSGAVAIQAAFASSGAALNNCTIINEWNNVAGHGVGANAALLIANCSIKVQNGSANCISSAAPVSMKFTSNVFQGATTPVNANVTQAITNVQDLQGNILI